MKKYLLILVAMMCFGINVYADGGKTCSVKQNGETVGYVTAWVDENYIVQVANNTTKTVTVTVTYQTCNGGRISVVVSQIEPNKTAIAGKTCKDRSVEKVENPICSSN